MLLMNTILNPPRAIDTHKLSDDIQKLMDIKKSLRNKAMNINEGIEDHAIECHENVGVIQGGAKRMDSPILKSSDYNFTLIVSI